MPYTVQGFMLIDVDVAALNNAGKDSTKTQENAVSTKKIYKNGKSYAYVSGQAWRYWWRETLNREFKWNISPVFKVDQKNTAYTAANPIQYDDDDMFGYMRAAKEIVETKGKQRSEDITLTRISPLKNSAFISVSPTRFAQHQAFSSRHEGSPVLYVKDEYCAVMKGMFSIALDQVGTFSSQQRTGFKNLNETLKQAALEENAEEIDDPYAKDTNGNPLKLYRLPKNKRAKRILDSIKALEVLSGGAMQTANLADVTPKLIVLATLAGGNHPFSHLAKDDLGKPVFSVEALEQVANDYRSRILGNIYVGRRMGFMDELEEPLQAFRAKDDRIFYGSVNVAISEYVKALESYIP